MDLYTGYIIDGELGNFRQSERDLFKINVKNAKKVTNFENSITTLDRGYVSLELMAWLIEQNMYFVQRVRSNFYKAEINQIKTNDSPIKIKLNSSRLRSFKDPELKEKYSKRIILRIKISNRRTRKWTKRKIIN